MVGGVARQVETGDLEAVEQETCAARVDVVGGYALKDLTDGRLDAKRSSGKGRSKAERRAPGRACGWYGVVAELFAAEAWAAAAMAVLPDGPPARRAVTS